MLRFLLFTIITLSITSLEANRGLQLKKMKEEQRVALVIGNNNYENLSKLKNPVNDARAIRNTLKQRGFNVIYKENATKKEMKKLVKKFAHQLSSGGVGMYYFAGHGVSVSGRNYLVGIDSLLEEEDEVEYETLALNYVSTKMEHANNRLNIIVLDACRNNPFGRSGGGGLSAHTAKGTFIAYATGVGKVASDGKSGKHGLFTKHLINSINEAGSDLAAVFKKTRKNVYDESNGKQFPNVSDGTLGEFYFTLPNTLNESPKKVSSNFTKQIQKEKNEPTKILKSGEKDFWNTICIENSKEYYTLYLNEYPDGYYADDARNKIRKIELDAKRKKELERKRKLALHKEEILSRWNIIKHDKFRDRFEHFMKKYPYSSYYKLAKLKVKTLPEKPPAYFDVKRNIMWQDEPYTEDERRAYNGNYNSGKVQDWDGAQTYCKNLSFAGYSTWRLPTEEEMKSIVNINRKPTVISEIKHAESANYWTSTSSNFSLASNMRFTYGNSTKSAKSEKYYVRCVSDLN